MDPGRWARIKEVFLAARECEPGRRAAVVSELCGDDQFLRAAVEAMLARESDAAGFLESPALEVEAMALAGEPRRVQDTSESARLTPSRSGRRQDRPVRPGGSSCSPRSSWRTCC